jgi:hypothetical protein
MWAWNIAYTPPGPSRRGNDDGDVDGNDGIESHTVDRR